MVFLMFLACGSGLYSVYNQTMPASGRFAYMIYTPPIFFLIGLFYLANTIRAKIQVKEGMLLYNPGLYTTRIPLKEISVVNSYKHVNYLTVKRKESITHIHYVFDGFENFLSELEENGVNVNRQAGDRESFSFFRSLFGKKDKKDKNEVKKKKKSKS